MERLRRHAVEPLYHNLCYTDRPEVVIPYSLEESEKRILRILSMGQNRQLHALMENFPWAEFEELLGEHIGHALGIARRRVQMITSVGGYLAPNIFDMYERHARRDLITGRY